MDKENAYRLLEETFGSDFDIERYTKFIKQLLNHLNFRLSIWSPWNEYAEYIDKYYSLGHYDDNSKNTIEVLAVKLKNTNSIDRARTMQRNFIAQYLGKTHKNAALVAFYGDGEDWRFSFVKMEYNLVKDESGKIKAKEELTPAKRYSFLVGKHEPNHTCKKQFVDLLKEEGRDPTLDEIEKAFSIEKVSKEFFEEYKQLFFALQDSLREIVSKDSIISAEFEDKNISTIDFSKKLLGQIVFLYFLQKKGWLGVKVNEPWGKGPKDFMRRLFGDANKGIKPLVPYNNFFNDILEHLFYDALATDRTANNHYHSHFDCKIPFLNGGLFEPINEYDWIITEIKLDDSIFKKILDTFDTFNFTVKEDEPLEKEVAVDPEMLGKVFENLLEVKDRKAKGAFYTPREIVHYMCQQSLINYLESNTTIIRKDIEQFIQRGDLVISNDQKVISDIESRQKRLDKGLINPSDFEKEIGHLLKSLDLPKSIVDNRERIDELLKTIKIVDPAVGSGAFPVGMMNEIVRARSILTIFYKADEQKKRTNYNLKREIIENCIYGVDIESSAIEITKLRFWLALIVDELDMQNIQPLPNLDHKIMCGNSLLEEFEGVKLFDERLLGQICKDNSIEIKQIDEKIAELNKEKRGIALGKKGVHSIKDVDKEIKRLERKKERIKEGKDNSERNSTLNESFELKVKESQKKLTELKRLQKAYFNEQNRELKKQLRAKIDKIEWELIEETLKEQNNLESMQKLEQYKKNKAKPFFLWKLYFAEVFQRENPGFDVVIANPPYVRQEEIKEIKKLLSNRYSVYNSTSDLYTYFYELGIYLLRAEGVLTFISSNKFMRAKYGVNLRQFFKNKTEIKEIIDFGEKHMFEAITNTCIFITKNKIANNNYIIFGDYINLDRSSKTIQSELDDSAWTIASGEEMNIKLKVSKNSKRLENWNIKIFRGLLTGFNEAFVIDNDTKLDWCKRNSKIKNHLKPVLRGRDIKRWMHVWGGLWVIVFPSGWTNDNRKQQDGENFFKSNFPEIYSYLIKIQEEYENSAIKMKAKGLYNRDDQGDYWWELRNCDYYDKFIQDKIIWIELTDKNKFSYSNIEEYLLAGAFFMIGDSLKYLLSFFNSKLCNYYFNLICNSSGMGTTQWKKFAMDKIPIRELNKEQQKPFIQLVDQILSITKDNDYLDNPDKQAKVKRLEKEIDQLVYKLYELTPEEIKIVEEFNNG